MDWSSRLMMTPMSDIRCSSQLGSDRAERLELAEAGQELRRHWDGQHGVGGEQGRAIDDGDVDVGATRSLDRTATHDAAWHQRLQPLSDQAGGVVADQFVSRVEQR